MTSCILLDTHTAIQLNRVLNCVHNVLLQRWRKSSPQTLAILVPESVLAPTIKKDYVPRVSEAGPY